MADSTNSTPHASNGSDGAASAAASAAGPAANGSAPDGSASSSGSASAPPRPPGDTPSASLLQSIKSLWQELPGLVSDRVELLSLELRRAGAALAQIVVLGIVAALLGLTAWVLLWGAIVSGLVALGLHVGLAMLVALLLNAVAAAVVLARVQKQVGLLRLPATRRHLTVKAAVEPLKPSGPPRSSTAAGAPTPSPSSAQAAHGAARSSAA